MRGVTRGMNQIDRSRAVSASAVAIDAAGAARLGAQRPVTLTADALAAAGRLSRATMSPVFLAGAARLIEFISVLACGGGIYLFYVAAHDGFDGVYALPIVTGSFLAVLFIEAAKGYAMPALRRWTLTLGRVFLAWTAVFALFAVAAFLAKSGDDYSRVWVASWYVAGLFVFAGVRLTMASLIRRWTKSGVLERRAVIVGGGQSAEDLIRALDAEPDNDIRICGIFDDRKDDRSPSVVAGHAKLGTIAELVEFGRLTRIDLLIVSLPITAETRLLQMLKHLWVLPVDIRLSAHTNKVRFRPRSYSFIGSLAFLDVFDKPIADWDYLLKRAFDLVFASLALVLLSPLMLATAIAIRLDSRGPILFRQKRYGFNNELIEVYKFRSMYVDQADANAARLVTKDDPRVTRIGRFIRKTSIDELPQLFNVVFKGNLSLVGPRPHALQAKAENRLYDEVVDGYFARHRVKPGITGWAQINGWRGETDTAEKIQQRVAHDLYYIENWSVLLDLKICLLTPFRLFDPERAY
jgi:Undecaprenyl-phosphate glucose phosphotransferase